MANTVKEKLSVAGLTKYGFKVGDEYINFSQKLADGDKAKVVPGAEFEAELYVSDGGKRYLNKILASVSVSAAPKVEAKPADADRAKHFTPKYQKKDESTTMSKGEWQAKDRSQLIGGLSHDAAAITAAFVSVSGEVDGATILKSYKFILEGMLKIRDEVK